MNNSDHFVRVEYVELKAKTPNAILIANENLDDEQWIPRSLLSYSCDKEIDNLNRGDEFTLRLREWKAEALGLDYSNE